MNGNNNGNINNATGIIIVVLVLVVVVIARITIILGELSARFSACVVLGIKYATRSA